MQFHEKKFLFSEKVNFLMIFCLFHCFHQTINKNTEYGHIILFFWKKINDVFFNVFRSINGILNKTSFYKYNISNLNKEEKICLKSDFCKFFFHIFLCWWKKTKKIHSFSRQYIFFSKIAQITYFYAFILILR